MNENTELKKIAQVFLKDGLDYLALSQAIKDYKNLLQGLFSIDLDNEENRVDIQLDNGIALGTTWAAMCIDDLVRTKRFIKGIDQAITYLKNKKGHPLHILYAGTGPYAALILPLLASYSEKELQFTLLEINEGSYNSVKQVLSKLGFLGFVRAIECEDATSYKIEDRPQIDMIISETMQHALQQEQQVPIMINLLSQVGKDVVIIPEKINLRLGALKFDTDGDNREDLKVLGELFELSTEQINPTISEKENSKQELQFPQKCITIDAEQLKHYDYLAILTDIQVYGDEKINLNDSGLTVPKRIIDVSSIKKDEIVMNARYKIHPVPELEYELSY